MEQASQGLTFVSPLWHSLDIWEQLTAKKRDR